MTRLGIWRWRRYIIGGHGLSQSVGGRHERVDYHLPPCDKPGVLHVGGLELELTPPFSLEASRIGSHRVIVVRGEVDLASAPELDTTLGKFKGQEVFVDLRKVEFMDSAGLRVLLTQQARIQEQGGNLRLVVTEGPVMRLLELAGVRDSFSIRPTINSQDSQDT